jgi:hypothetical protein
MNGRINRTVDLDVLSINWFDDAVAIDNVDRIATYKHDDPAPSRPMRPNPSGDVWR